MQTKLGSFIEAWTNIGVGFTINWCMNMLVLPLLGFRISGGQAFEIGVLFTAVSVARSYCLRRLFNKWRFGNVLTNR